MSGKPKNAVSPTRSEDFPQWYQQVIKVAELAENSPVRGCMVIKPWGYSIWELMQKELDQMFKDTGHENAYFPLFIPKSYIEKEAEHVEGFAKECAVVTHSRLVDDGEGGLKPGSPLEEPLIVRPTSETIIGEVYADWVQSYRDLPLLINQWANVVRWEMRTRIFLRTAEFLWQEGHTVHATSEEAVDETIQMLNVYANFAENYMAMPVIKGEKTEGERFPGAVNTYCIEAMMQDGKALQAGTSHFLGQNFAKSCGIKYLSKEGSEELAWTTSWGVSTRLIGGLIMTHSDDDGLVLPPRLAPKQIVITPVIPKEEQREAVMPYCDKLFDQLKALNYAGSPVRVKLDDRDMRGGEKAWHWIKKGVPMRIEVGPRDVESGKVVMLRRDKGPKDKLFLTVEELVAQATSILQDIQDAILRKATEFRDSKTTQIATKEEFEKCFSVDDTGFAVGYWAGDPELEDKLSKDYKTTVRCVLMEDFEAGKCIFTGASTTKKAVFAKAY
ncbi:MAG: proline--tRNA ligase [Opitutales bacterium]|nr:proline--tRNA ligase [Opitutales bacterium]